MTAFYLKAKSIFTETGVVYDSFIKVDQGRIAAIDNSPAPNEQVIDFGDMSIIPGLIDLHIHGSGGADVMDASYNAIDTISKSVARNGVTGFLATTVTDSWQRNIDALDNVRFCVERGVSGAQLLGAYSEALFFSEQFRGAHDSSYFLTPTRERLDEMIEASGNTLRSVALAPEIKGGLDAVSYLSDQNIRVMIGHTGADYDTCKKAFERGAVGGVHIFNQMQGLHHRQPGTVGAVLYHDDIYAELIADGVHVHPVVMDLVYRLKGADRLALITDCICAGGLSDGQYQLGRLSVEVVDGVARTSSGALAGSTLTLNQAVANMTDVGVPASEAVHMASLTPAKLLGLEESMGSIKVGKRASLAVVNERFEVQATYLDGTEVFRLH